MVRSPHWSRLARTAAAAAVLLVSAGGVTSASAASTAAAPPARLVASTPPAGSSMRRYPTIAGAATARARATKPAGSPLQFGGGNDGIGVTTGSPRVYLVFWGSQWGSGDPTSGFSNDPSNMAPREVALMNGIGAQSEQWSGVMTQYCEGVSAGATSCPASASHVGYPAGGALAGVWVDTGSAAPAQAADHEIGVEAVAAASHFGNTSASANRSAQYVIVSATGTHPGGFGTPSASWCAWHDWNGDSSMGGGPVSSSVGDIAFTNLPYIPDMGSSCGAGYVNGGSGDLDGATIVEGHEYAETISDQNPAGGWTDSSGAENGDKCAWVGTGGTGGAQDVAFATGSFPMQATWSNDSSDCRIAHPVLGGGGACRPGQAVGNPGFETASPAPWTASLGVVGVGTAAAPAHSGTRRAQLGGRGTAHTETVAQSVAIPTGCHATLSLYVHIDTQDRGTVVHDSLRLSAAGRLLARWTNLNPATGYHLHSYDLSAFAGRTVPLVLTGSEDASLATSFLVDDVTVQLS